MIYQIEVIFDLHTSKKPEVCVSFIKQFWRSAKILTDDNGNVKIQATIDGHSLSITEGSLRRHLKLDDQDGITSLPTTEIFAQLALMGYATDSDKLTFQKGAFSPQWRFLIHTILHCLSPKKTAWEQFSSNIAAAVICLATNRKFNYSRMIFDHMVSNISSPHKFLMYPRVLAFMKTSHQGIFGDKRLLYFPTMLDATEPLTCHVHLLLHLHLSLHLYLHFTCCISSQPSPTQPSPTQPTPTQPSPTQLSPSQPGTEYHPPTPHDSPLHAVQIGVLEADLLKTKKTYSSAYTKLILRVKKLDGKASDEVSTAGKKKGTASEEVPTVSTAEVHISTAGGTVTYSRRSAEKRQRQDKGKAILIEEEPKKKSKKDLEQEQLSYAEAIRLEEQMNEEQRAQIARDAEIAKQWDEEERKRAMDEAKATKEIDWNLIFSFMSLDIILSK
ncbi:hypothetical protein Tco_0799030 [Tanacetum coccineum]